MINFGAFSFGLVIGWITYRTLRRTHSNGISDIATVVGAVGGAAVVSLFPQEIGAFGAYCIGLAVGFFGYLVVAGIIDARATRNKSFKAVSRWLGGEPERTEATDPSTHYVPPQAR